MKLAYVYKTEMGDLCIVEEEGKVEVYPREVIDLSEYEICETDLMKEKIREIKNKIYRGKIIY